MGHRELNRPAREAPYESMTTKNWGFSGGTEGKPSEFVGRSGCAIPLKHGYAVSPTARASRWVNVNSRDR